MYKSSLKNDFSDLYCGMPTPMFETRQMKWRGVKDHKISLQTIPILTSCFRRKVRSSIECLALCSTTTDRLCLFANFRKVDKSCEFSFNMSQTGLLVDPTKKWISHFLENDEYGKYMNSV